MDNLRVKIAVPTEAAKRHPVEKTKRLRDIGEYTDVGWKVLGVPFGGPIEGRDLEGEAFTEDTEIWLKVGDAVNLTYYHGYGPDDPIDIQDPPIIIGRAIYLGSDNRGHWFDPKLDVDEPLAQRLVKAGPDGVKASSGAVDHLVRFGRGGLITVWPVGELALFDTNEFRIPANAYAVIEAKSKGITEATPEAVDAAVGAVEAEDNAIKSTTIPKEELTMSDELKNTVETPPEEPKNELTLDAVKSLFTELTESIDAKIDAAVDDKVKAMKAAPGIEKGAPTVMKTANLGDPDPVQDFNDWIRTGKGKIKAHKSVVELPDGRGGKVKAALQEGTTTEGGYLVPADYLGRIIMKRSEMDLLTRLGVQTFSTDKYQFYFPTEGTSMTKFSIVSEEGAVSAAENEPTFGSAGTPPVTLYKFMKLIKISSELEEDSNSGLDMALVSMIARAWALTNNYYVQVGSGTGQPQGAFVGGTAGLTLDSASAIGPAEIPELIGKLKTPYRDRAIMVMNRTTAAYLSGLTGNQFVFRVPPASMTWAGGEDLGIGYPVVPTEDAAAIAASAKSLLFGNFDFYGWVTNRSLEVKRLVELFAGNDQIGLQCKFRAGGAVLQSEAFQYATHPTA